MTDGPVVKNTGSSSRGLGLSFQDTHSDLQPSLNSDSRDMNCTTFWMTLNGKYENVVKISLFFFFFLLNFMRHPHVKEVQTKSDGFNVVLIEIIMSLLEGILR